MKKYQHYKGGTYEFLYVATDEATGEDLVVYRNVADGSIYTRPAEKFFGSVTQTDTKVVKRFEPIKEVEPDKD